MLVNDTKINNGKVKGFTIVELLIVVVVIAILAAITIVAYNGITNRSKQSAAQSLVAQVNKKILAYAALNSDTYPADLSAIDISAADQANLQYSVDNTATPRTYGLTGTNGNYSYYVSNASTTPTAGGYPGHGQNGVAAITNLITNPSAETSTSGWTTYGSASVNRVSTWKTSGNYSFQMTNSGTTNVGDMRIGGGGVSSIPLGLQVGKTYTMSARVYQPVAFTGGFDRGPGILFWYSLNGSSWTESFGPKVPAAAGLYTTTYTFTIPAGTTGVLIGLGAASSTTGQSVYYDSVILTEGSTAYTYADGNSTNWVWNGSANLSTSTGPAP
jgi:prepilin-type N-terminal cleavage/methylation domain-containing protein